MKRGGKTFVCLLSSFALALGAEAITSDLGIIKQGENARSLAGAHDGSDAPYDAIVRRNVFDLRDPVPSNDTNAPPPLLSDVKLTGIMTIFQRKQALFMVQKPVSAGKSPEPSESCILSEGERQGGLEVLGIDQKGAKVTIRKDGVVSTITFEAPKEAAAGGVAVNPPVAQMRRPGFRPNINRDAAAPPPLPIP